MSLTPLSLTQVDPPLSPSERLPTMYDLPSETIEEPGLPDEFHLLQPRLLDDTFEPNNYSQEQIFSASDLNLYYDLNQTNWYKRPDWFGVVGVNRLYENRDLRMSYVIWQERVNPLIIVELLSPGTEKEDLGQDSRNIQQPPTKWEVYERILQVPYYVVFDRYTNQLRGFQLSGSHYNQLQLIESRIWLPEIELGLGLWQGTYRGINRLWLRWYDRQENWILTPLEREKQALEREKQALEREKQALEREKQARQLAQQRAERLAERLRQAGINPDEI